MTGTTDLPAQLAAVAQVDPVSVDPVNAELERYVETIVSTLTVTVPFRLEDFVEQFPQKILLVPTTALPPTICGVTVQAAGHYQVRWNPHAPRHLALHWALHEIAHPILGLHAPREQQDENTFAALQALMPDISAEEIRRATTRPRFRLLDPAQPGLHPIEVACDQFATQVQARAASAWANPGPIGAHPGLRAVLDMPRGGARGRRGRHE